MSEAFPETLQPDGGSRHFLLTASQASSIGEARDARTAMRFYPLSYWLVGNRTQQARFPAFLASHVGLDFEVEPVQRLAQYPSKREEAFNHNLGPAENFPPRLGGASQRSHPPPHVVPHSIRSWSVASQLLVRLSCWLAFVQVSFPAVPALNPAMKKAITLLAGGIEVDKTKRFSRHNGLLAFTADHDTGKSHWSPPELFLLLLIKEVRSVSRIPTVLMTIFFPGACSRRLLS